MNRSTTCGAVDDGFPGGQGGYEVFGDQGGELEDSHSEEGGGGSGMAVEDMDMEDEGAESDDEDFEPRQPFVDSTALCPPVSPDSASCKYYLRQHER